MKKYVNESNINKIKRVTLNKELIDFNKTISENKIENGDIVYFIVLKDLAFGSFINSNKGYNNFRMSFNGFDNINFNNSMNMTSSNFYNALQIEIEFTLIFINGETINVIAKPNENFISILQKYLDEERIRKITKATLNSKPLDFDKTISENKIKKGDLIYLTVPKDFKIDTKKFIYIHFFFLFPSGNKINIVEHINTLFYDVLKKKFNENVNKIKSAKLNGKPINFQKTISENKIEEKSVINIITSKDFDRHYFTNENAMNFTSSNFSNNYKGFSFKNYQQIGFVLLFTNGEYINVIANKGDSFKSVIKYFFKEESIKKIIKGTLNNTIIDFNKTISENKIEYGSAIRLIVSKDFNLKNDLNNSFYLNNNTNYYYYNNNFYNSNIKNTYKNLSEFEFFIIFTIGEQIKVKGKQDDTLKSIFETLIKNNFPNQINLLNIKTTALLEAHPIDINKKLSELRITQGSRVLFTFNQNFCNKDECKIHLHIDKHEHGLVLLYSNRSWFCDVCKLQFSNKEQTYYCSICDFDVCNHCIGNIRKYPLNYIFNENIFFYHFNYQSHKHRLIYCRTSRYDDKTTKWTCQLCNKTFGDEIWSFFCTNCNYDICLSCA